MPPETTEQTPEARLRTVIDEAEALSRKRGPSADEVRALDTLLAEGETLRTQIAQAGRTASLREWADTTVIRHIREARTNESINR